MATRDRPDSPAPASVRALCARALRALAHPTSVAWVLLLIFNDAVLRWIRPSWVTGKLSDVAWLAVAPLAVAVPLALILGRRGRRAAAHRVVIVTAIAGVGAVFAVVKAVPAATEAFRVAFRAVFGWRPLIVTDPTDLLALPALGLAWARWAAAGGERRISPKQAWGSRRDRLSAGMGLRGERIHKEGRATSRLRWSCRLRWGWGVLALVALASLGNAGPPDEGILCLSATDAGLIAGPQHTYAYTSRYVSTNGGLSWTEMAAEGAGVDYEVACEDPAGAWTLEGPIRGEGSAAARGLGAGEALRFVPGEGIERSVDGGETWAWAVRLTGQDARRAYYQMTRNVMRGAPAPHAALVDPLSGNVVAAMGHEGVLVRTAPGAWAWVDVGPYRYEPLRSVDQIATLLFGEIGLGLAAGLVAVALAGWRGVGTPAAAGDAQDGGTKKTAWLGWVARGLAVAAAVGVALALLIVHPATMGGYGTMLSTMVVIAALVGTLAAAVLTVILVHARGRRGRWLAWLGWLALTGVLFVAPFVAWAVGWIAGYEPASWIAVTVTAVAWLAAAVGTPE